MVVIEFNENYMIRANTEELYKRLQESVISVVCNV